MRFIQFEPEHFLWVMDVDQNVPEKIEELKTLGQKAISQGPCLTLLGYNDEAIACGGMRMLFEHSAEIWLRLSRKAGPNAVREIKAQMYRWIEDHHLVRLQASGPTTWTNLPRWWEWLGMQREGILRNYGPHGEDYFLYSWVRL
jgi:hypothetical protein